jgi:hypothetical protein
MSPDEIAKEAFERLHSWKVKCATLLLEFTDPPHKFSIVVEIWSVRDDHSSITLKWLRRAIDPNGPFVFMETQGYFGVFLDGATFAIADAPNRSLTISRGPFLCDLTQLRESAFA